MYVILGKNGYIAEAFAKELSSRDIDFVSISRKDVDYLDKKEFSLYLSHNFYSKVVSNHNVTIINCAGFVGKPNVDSCEQSKSECLEANVFLPSMLSSLCADQGYRFIHISSGCIYNGYRKYFTEDDIPNFDFQNGSFYSGTKGLAEKLIIKNNPDCYLFRLRIPFDEFPSPRNYITKLLSYESIINAKNSLSHRGDFAKYSIDLIEKNVPFGIYNITNKGHITAEQVIELIKKHNLSNKDFKFFSNLDEFMQQITAPRSNCILNTSKIEEYIDIRTVHEAIEESIVKYKSLSV